MTGIERPEAAGEPEILGRATVSQARVVVVDDDAIVRQGLKALLPTFGAHHEVVATYSHAEPLLEERPEADIAIVDLDLQRATRIGMAADLETQLAVVGLKLSDAGLEPNPEDAGAALPRLGVAAVRAVCQAGYPAIVYTSGDNRIVLANCLAAGASGVVHKIDEVEALSQAVTDVLSGHIVLTPSLIGLAEVFERRDLLPSLSGRQREVLKALSRGYPHKWIAKDLNVSTKTVDFHWEQTKNKFVDTLRTTSAAELQRILGLGPVDLIG